MVTRELAAGFSGFVTLNANITLENINLFVDFKNFVISEVQVTANNCGLYDRNYEHFFADLASMLMNVINAEIRKGIDLAN